MPYREFPGDPWIHANVRQVVVVEADAAPVSAAASVNVHGTVTVPERFTTACGRCTGLAAHGRERATSRSSASLARGSPCLTPTRPGCRCHATCWRGRSSRLPFRLSSNVTAPTLAAAKEQGAVFAYGNFITVLINFLIVAWILFMLVRAANTLRRSEPAPPPAPSTTDKLLTEIRDLLKNK